MAIGKGHDGAIVGFVTEGTWGTSGTPDKFLVLVDGGITLEDGLLDSAGVNAVYLDKDDTKQGNIVAGFSGTIEMRYEGFETILYHTLGAVSSAEVATFTVSSSNKYIEFKEGGGSQLTATLTEGTYAIGISSAVSDSLCEEIKTQLEAAGAGTYTVTCPTATQIVNIAVAGVVSAVQILWKTGSVHGSDNADSHVGTLLGYDDTADTSSAASLAADSAVVPAYDHTFSLTAELMNGEGLTWEVDYDETALTLAGGKVTSLELSNEPGGFLMAALSLAGKDIDDPASATSPSLETSELIDSYDFALTYNSVSQTCNAFSLSINNNLKTDDYKLGSRTIAEPTRSGKREITGSMQIDFEDTTEYTDFRNATSRAIVAIYTGSAIKTSYNYSLTINLPYIRLRDALPVIEDEGIIKCNLPFQAWASDSSNLEMTIVLRNTNASVS